MGHEYLLAEKRGNIGTLTINRPGKGNSLSPDLLFNLHLTLRQWSEDGDIRCLVITGKGDKAFSSGFDILSIPTDPTPEIAELMKKENPLEMGLASVKNYPFPTIAMLNGHAFGAGLNLALCCDFRFGADDIKLGMPAAKLGLIYHPEGLRQFVEVLGMAVTREVFFSARTYQGDEVMAMGFVNRLVSRDNLAAVTYGMAQRISENAPLSLKGTKAMLDMLSHAFQLSSENSEKTEALMAEGFSSEDLKEGQAAFIEKRKPIFKGR